MHGARQSRDSTAASTSVMIKSLGREEHEPTRKEREGGETNHVKWTRRRMRDGRTKSSDATAHLRRNTTSPGICQRWLQQRPPGPRNREFPASRPVSISDSLLRILCFPSPWRREPSSSSSPALPFLVFTSSVVLRKSDVAYHPHVHII